QFPGAMRGVGLLLLAALLRSELALALQCHFCSGYQDTSQCVTMACPRDHNVCFTGSVTVTTGNSSSGDGQLQHKGCAPSCDYFSKTLEALVDTKIIKDLVPQGLSKLEVQKETCCDKDLCSGVAQAGRCLWALAAGLLLSLGVALLWAQV
uniref:UPAR/Ly6 domain-containing protein n=1 Tax=Loxodonta africana TaxID=9785 RepID=G3UFD6_LOXAF